MTVTRLENWKVEVESNPNPRLVHVLKNIIAQIETLTDLADAKISGPGSPILEGLFQAVRSTYQLKDR